MRKLINKNEGWPQGPRVWRVWGAHQETPRPTEVRHRLGCPAHLAHPEINYACFHITFQPPLWETLTPSTLYALVFLRPPPPPPTHRRLRRGKRQVNVTQSHLLQLHETPPGQRLQYLWCRYPLVQRIHIPVINRRQTQPPSSHRTSVIIRAMKEQAMELFSH